MSAYSVTAARQIIPGDTLRVARSTVQGPGPMVTVKVTISGRAPGGRWNIQGTIGSRQTWFSQDFDPEEEVKFRRY